MKKVKISKVKQVVVKSSDKVEKYLEFMEKMPGMLLDYVTHCNLPSRLKSMIAMHLSVGKRRFLLGKAERPDCSWLSGFRKWRRFRGLDNAHLGWRQSFAGSSPN